MDRQVLVPDIGDFEDVPVIEVLVAAGDTVAPEDPLVTLESDKATMDVPVAARRAWSRRSRSPSATRSRRAPRSLTLESPRAASADAAAAPAARRAGRAGGRGDGEAARRGGRGARARGGRRRRARAGAARSAPREPTGGPAYASPACAAWRASSASTSRSVAGTGRKGRITKEDVEARQGAAAPAPAARRRRGAASARAVAEGRLREVRRGRARAADADQADQRPGAGTATG